MLPRRHICVLVFRLALCPDEVIFDDLLPLTPQQAQTARQHMQGQLFAGRPSFFFLFPHSSGRPIKVNYGRASGGGSSSGGSTPGYGGAAGYGGAGYGAAGYGGGYG